MTECGPVLAPSPGFLQETLVSSLVSSPLSEHLDVPGAPTPAAGPHPWPPLPQALRPGHAVLCKHSWPPSKPPQAMGLHLQDGAEPRGDFLLPLSWAQLFPARMDLPFPFLICSGIKRRACFKVSRPPRPLGLPGRGPGNVLGSGGRPGEGM